MQLRTEHLKSEIYRSLSREDDPRVSDFIVVKSFAEAKDLKKGLALIGYPDDEGVTLNGGRAGAAMGPSSIRRQLAKLCQFSKQLPIYDFGDIESKFPLEKKHHETFEVLSQFPRSLFPVHLGGGHDWAYPDVANFLQSQFLKSKKKRSRNVVINLDAHLDVRKMTKHPHSGTPFYRLLEEFPDFELIQVGIQTQVNSESHFTYCQKKKVTVVTLNDVAKLKQILKRSLRGRPNCFLSVDIDGFTSAIAPGCSAPNPDGLLFSHFMDVLTVATRSTNLRGLGIYEVNPTLDRDEQTAKLAAKIIYETWRTLSESH